MAGLRKPRRGLSGAHSGPDHCADDLPLVLFRGCMLRSLNVLAREMEGSKSPKVAEAFELLSNEFHWMLVSVLVNIGSLLVALLLLGWRTIIRILLHVIGSSGHEVSGGLF